MKIFLTFDYELFFGADSGTVDKCMIEPSNDLMELVKGKNVRYTFFVDIGYIIAAERYPELTEEKDRVIEHLKTIVSKGHDLQLHIHPHWEKAQWIEGRWKMRARYAYKLVDFPVEEAADIIRRYKKRLEDIKGEKMSCFRAGGWCIQPFEHIRKTFLEEGIRVDSSVIPGFYMFTDEYALNFTDVPFKSHYSFENNVCKEDEGGNFTEYPIMSFRYNPSFYWRLYLLGKLFPAQHKMIGNGTFISHGSKKYTQLLTYTNMHLSTDGYYASKLEAGLNKAQNLEFEEMVVIGHPKGNTRYSLRKLGEFIDKYHNEHAFQSFKSLE